MQTIACADAGEERMAQLLGNLVSNALRHTSSGGTITLAAIAKSIVEVHQGEINVSSAGNNQGTTFTIKLPIFRSV